MITHRQIEIHLATSSHEPIRGNAKSNFSSFFYAHHSANSHLEAKLKYWSSFTIANSDMIFCYHPKNNNACRPIIAWFSSVTPVIHQSSLSMCIDSREININLYAQLKLGVFVSFPLSSSLFFFFESSFSSSWFFLYEVLAHLRTDTQTDRQTSRHFGPSDMPYVSSSISGRQWQVLKIVGKTYYNINFGGLIAHISDW